MHDMSSDSDNSDQEGSSNRCATNIHNKYLDGHDSLLEIGWADVPLRAYQLTGVNWLIDCYKKGHGAILGDEMGLGKTCQTIAFMVYVKANSKSWKPNLVICPRSVLENWEAELKRFAPKLKVKCFVGDKDHRNTLSQEIKSEVRAGKFPFNVLITTPELCLKDGAFLSSLDWHVVVVDEAHRLKNSESMLYQTLKEWHMKQAVLLTGTPVQNNLEELYSLLSFASPTDFKLSRLDNFIQRFKDIDQSEGVSELHKLLRPYLLRRTKEEVLKDLPQKSELVMFHGISKLQKKIYKAILTKDLGVFESGDYAGARGPPRMMNILMQLRKCVNHPYLFDGVEQEPFVLGEHLVEASGKLTLIDSLLNYLHTTGHKVLLFSQMTHMLDILQDYLGYRGYIYERLDGSVRGEERFLAVQNFNKNDDTFVFLLSTKAGGQGLNLVAADTVIFVDSDFNPQNDLQAAARAHRIGQTSILHSLLVTGVMQESQDCINDTVNIYKIRPVKVIRLIGSNTVEEIILRRAEEKLKLTEKVIEEGQFSLGISKTSLITDDKIQLKDILKFGVENLLINEESDETNVDFTEMLGPTVNGEWQEDEKTADPSLQAEMNEGPSSMYEFEGTDYSKEPTAADIKAFDELMEAEKLIVEEKMVAERSLRRKTSVLMGMLPEIQRKQRKPLTQEELDERNRKRKEAAEKRAQQREEAAIRKAQEQRKQKEEMWKDNGYVSSCVEISSEDEDEDEQVSPISLQPDDDEDDISTKSRSIHYVSGDVTRPIKAGTSVNLIVHCADDAGNWGKGGLFSAISSRSKGPQEQYELAGSMLDLSLGDCHLISMDNEETRDGEEDWLALIIAQHRDKRNNLSGIKLSALQQGLKCVHYLAKARKGSVHLPRIGHDTPGFNWYGTERLIKKYLASKGIPTYIYYFPRKRSLKRKPSLTTDEPDRVIRTKARNDVDLEPAVKTKKRGLSDLFHGVRAYIHPTQMLPPDLKRYKRYLIAYDGDLDGTVETETTHVIVHPKCPAQELKNLVPSKSEAELVSCDWISQCLTEGKLVETAAFVVNV